MIVTRSQLLIVVCRRGAASPEALLVMGAGELVTVGIDRVTHELEN